MREHPRGTSPCLLSSFTSACQGVPIGGYTVDNFRPQLPNRWETYLKEESGSTTFVRTPEGAERLLVAAMTSMPTQRVGSFGRLLLSARIPRSRAFGTYVEAASRGESGRRLDRFREYRVEEDPRPR